MTTVYYDINDIYLVLLVRDHAGDTGVCNAISTLLYTLGGYINNHQRATEMARIRLEPGDAEIRVSMKRTQKYDDELAKNALVTAFEMTLFGLEQLRNNFPDLITLKDMALIHDD